MGAVLLGAAGLPPAPGAPATLAVAGAVAAECTQADPLDRKHCELGGTASVLGAPVGPAYPVAGGRARDYAGGTIYWSAATAAFEVHGAIGARYRALGGPAGVLGFPLTDERSTAGGVGRVNHFQGGSVYWSPSSGAHEVHGSIGTHYLELGGAEGLLGFPLTDEMRTPDGAGRFNHFQRGSIYWSPRTPAVEVHGAIREKWAALGWERSFLGYPVTDETSAPDGVGRFTHFQGGSVYWTAATGAHEVHGSIRERWARLGWERSALGYPIGDETGVNGGRSSSFQRGVIRWTAATGVTRVTLLEPFAGAGTWVTRFRFSREFAGPNPPVRPSDVDAMAAAGVATLYLQAAAADPRYPELISPDLLGEFLVRAHARGMQVVGWYLPQHTDVPADLRRLQAIVDFRASGHRFDAVGLDIEDRRLADVAARNRALVDTARRLRAANPDVTLAAIVLPPVITDVLSPAFWPQFPWRPLSESLDVWVPMAYWLNPPNPPRPPPYDDPYRFVSESVTRLRANVGERCAVVAVAGGWGTGVPPDAYAGMARAARDTGAVGVSVFDWTTTPPGAWPNLRAYDVRGC